MSASPCFQSAPTSTTTTFPPPTTPATISGGGVVVGSSSPSRLGIEPQNPPFPLPIHPTPTTNLIPGGVGDASFLGCPPSPTTPNTNNNNDNKPIRLCPSPNSAFSRPTPTSSPSKTKSSPSPSSSFLSPSPSQNVSSSSPSFSPLQPPPPPSSSSSNLLSPLPQIPHHHQQQQLLQPQQQQQLLQPPPQFKPTPENNEHSNTTTNPQDKPPSLFNGSVPTSCIKPEQTSTTTKMDFKAILSKNLGGDNSNRNINSSSSSSNSSSSSSSSGGGGGGSNKNSSSTNAMDLNSLSYHGIRKLAAMPTVNTKCISSDSPGIPKRFGFEFSTGSPPLTPNLEETSSGYSPLLKRSAGYGGGGGGGLGGLGGIGGLGGMGPFGGFSAAMSTPPKFKKNKKNKPENSIIGVLAAQTLKIASINGLGELDKLENDLEEEINYENKSNAKTVIGRWRREGHHHLHSKVVLFLVVLLNIIDCVLVMGELTLDFHHVSHLLENKKDMIDSFANELEDKYSPYLHDLVDEEKHVILQAILDSSIVWPQTIVQTAIDNVTAMAAQCHSYVTSAAILNNQTYDAFLQQMPDDSDWTTAQPISTCFQPLVSIFREASSSRSSSETVAHQEKYRLTSIDEPNEKLIIVAHKLHYISVAILSVLVVLLILKVVCAGKRFLRSKMAVFDGVVVVISFTLDVVFIKGIHIFNTQDFVIILTFLLPWRIIRVLNSLIAAVLDKQRLNLKIIYTQKKKITRNLTEVNNKVDVMQRQIQILQGLCSSRGITDGDVRKILGTDPKSEKQTKSDSKKNNSGGHGLASMMALGKLAFQAADALAPVPDVKGRSTPTSPISTPMFTDTTTCAKQPPLQTTSNTTTTTTTPSAHSDSNNKMADTSPAVNSNSNNSNNTITPSSSSSTSASANTNGVVAHAPTSNGSVPTGMGTKNNTSDNEKGNPHFPPSSKSNTDTATLPSNAVSQDDSQQHSSPSLYEKAAAAAPRNTSKEAGEDVEMVIEKVDVEAGEENSVNSETPDIPEVSQSLSLDIESAATISMDLRDDDDDDYKYDDDKLQRDVNNHSRVISASIDDVNVEFEMENETAPPFSPSSDTIKGDNHVNDTNATSRL